MIKESEKKALESYRAYLERTDEKYCYVNELKNPSTEKAVVCSLFCCNFEDDRDWIPIVDRSAIIYFWVSRKLSFYACVNGCNAKIPKWLAIKAIERCLDEEKTNLVKNGNNVRGK